MVLREVQPKVDRSGFLLLNYLIEFFLPSSDRGCRDWCLQSDMRSSIGTPL